MIGTAPVLSSSIFVTLGDCPDSLSATLFGESNAREASAMAESSSDRCKADGANDSLTLRRFGEDTISVGLALLLSTATSTGIVQTVFNR